MSNREPSDYCEVQGDRCLIKNIIKKILFIEPASRLSLLTSSLLASGPERPDCWSAIGEHWARDLMASSPLTGR